MASGNKLNNYIGVKYHIELDFPADTISLHNFSNGYCGIVKIEGNKYNLCYLTTAANLKRSNGRVKDMEQTILQQNPHLKKIFNSSRSLFEAPLTISQISFDPKKQVEDHVLMIGDAAGMITPLCGNGMSMALHGSQIAAVDIDNFLSSKCTRTEMEHTYSRQWKQQFARRLRMGRRIQRLFGSNRLTNLMITLLRSFPALLKVIIRKTHGKPF